MLEAAYCISLDRRPDRWKSFCERLPEDWPLPPVQRVAAIDGKLCRPPAWWRQGGGAWGCYRSHISVIEQALNSGIKSIAIFEDDATFCEDFAIMAKEFLSRLPADWQQAYLGGQHLGKPAKHSPGVVIPRNVNRTHAYCINGRDALADIYQWLNAADQWVDTNHVDHHYGRLHKNRRIRAFAPEQWLCGQAAGRSDISCKTPPERWWNTRPPLPSTFVAVIGLHRSGSSCVAMILHKLGVNMGDKLGGYESRKGGGGEAAGLAAICEGAAKFPSANIASRPAADRRLEKWIRQRMSRHKVSGGKYPHLCAFGDTLNATCGPSLRVIHCDRPLEDSIESLKRRSRKCSGWLAASDEQCESVQRWLWGEKQKFLRTCDHLSVEYGRLMSQPESVVDEIISYLNLKPAPQQRQEAIDHVLVEVKA